MWSVLGAGRQGSRRCKLAWEMEGKGARYSVGVLRQEGKNDGGSFDYFLWLLLARSRSRASSSTDVSESTNSASAIVEQRARRRAENAAFT